MKSQRGRGTDDLLGLFGIVHSRQLDADPGLPLALHRGFGDPQLVDPLLEDGQVLGHPIVDEQIALILGQLQAYFVPRALQLPGLRLTAAVLTDDRHPAIRLLAGRQTDRQLTGCYSADGGPSEFGFAKLGAQAIHQVAGLRLEDEVAVHTDEQLRAPAQIQPQLDGRRSQLQQPARRIGVKFQGDGRGIAPLLHQQLTGPLLLLLIGKHQLYLPSGGDNFLRRHILTSQQLAIRRRPGPGAVQPQRRLFAKEGGQGVKTEGEKHQQQQGVLPFAHAIEPLGAWFFKRHVSDPFVNRRHGAHGLFRRFDAPSTNWREECTERGRLISGHQESRAHTSLSCEGRRVRRLCV